MCAACGVVKEEEEVGIKCLICTFHNEPDAVSCIMCKGDLTNIPQTSSSSSSKRLPTVVAMSSFGASSFHKKRTLRPEAINSSFIKASDIKDDGHDDEDHKSMSTVSDFDVYEEEGSQDSAGQPKAHLPGNEHDDEIITISDSDESLGEESAHDDDEIEEFADDQFFVAAQAPHHPLPGVVEVAPTLPSLTMHYW